MTSIQEFGLTQSSISTESWENEDDTWNELEDATWSYLTSDSLVKLSKLT